MEPRIHPPKEFKSLLDRLIGDESPFDAYRDVLFFAAVLGVHLGRRKPLEGTAEGIRWEVMRNRPGADVMIQMIAAFEVDDPTILMANRLDERSAIFEEYANGGLKELDRRLALDSRPISDVLVTLIQEVLSEASTSAKDLDLAKATLSF